MKMHYGDKQSTSFGQIKCTERKDREESVYVKDIVWPCTSCGVRCLAVISSNVSEIQMHCSISDHIILYLHGV